MGSYCTAQGTLSRENKWWILCVSVFVYLCIICVYLISISIYLSIYLYVSAGSLCCTAEIGITQHCKSTIIKKLSICQNHSWKFENILDDSIELNDIAIECLSKIFIKKDEVRCSFYFFKRDWFHSQRAIFIYEYDIILGHSQYYYILIPFLTSPPESQLICWCL